MIEEGINRRWLRIGAEGMPLVWIDDAWTGSSFREHLSQEAEYLRHVQLHVLQVEQVLVVLLLKVRKNIMRTIQHIRYARVAYLLKQVIDLQIHL